ncbi:hypothetical protein TSAR_015742, partial [Trichomalopsis sarcophagae]
KYYFAEFPECAVKYLKEFKPKLYRMYKKKGFDLESVLPERYRKYERLSDDKIYLGLGVSVGYKTWRIAQYKRRTGFLCDLGYILWKRQNLANRCLNLSKVRNQIPNRSPVKLCSPRKLNLYLNLYEDYLKKHKAYENISTKSRDFLIKDCTQHLSAHIRDVRADSINTANQAA